MRVITPSAANKQVFRFGEEGVSQAAALLDICRRRKLSGRRTLVAFLDFAKAFDMVDHSLLLYKIFCMGVRGKSYHFIRTLYAHPTVSVALSGLIGDAIPIKRGVRQGCPLSPILFCIFINDLLLNCKGASVPDATNLQVPGLLFADDAALLAGSFRKMQKNLDLVGEWAVTNRMKFNIPKCGVMVVTPITRVTPNCC